MTGVFQILLALGALLLPDLLELELEGRLSPLGLLLLLVPYALALLVRFLVRRRRLRAAVAFEGLLAFSPVLVHLAAVLLFGWLAYLERIGIVDDTSFAWPGPGLLVALLPFLTVSVLAIDARARLHSSSQEGIRRVRAFQLRMLVAGLIPIALYFVISGVVGANEVWRINLEEVGLLSAVFTTLVLLLFALMLPMLLVRAWSTVSLEPGPLRSLLEELARRARFRCRDLVVWRTGAQMSNAAVVGFTRWSRVVLFSDVLLATLRPYEVAAVFAHEMGHARRRHAPTFAAFALAVLLTADLVGRRYAGEDPVVAGWILAGALALWLSAFGYLSRRFELEADLSSRELLGTSLPLIGALEKVTGAHAYERNSWRHFSTAQRVRFLMAVDSDPELGRALGVRLRRATRAIVAFFLIALALQARGMVADWSEDRIAVDLRLGRYEAAAEAVATQRAAGRELDEDLARWTAAAASLALDERTSAGLESAALRALDRGDVERAVDVLELAWLRGRDVGTALDALDARTEGRVDPRAEEELAPAWRAALEGLD